MPLDRSVAYNTLIASPATFLKLYPVRCFGHPGASGIAQYYFCNRGASFRPGSVLGTRSWHATESFEIRAAGAMGAVGGIGNGHGFQAHSVHMDVGIVAMNLYRLDHTGPNVMITGQLSGCAFVALDAGGNQVDVAHVQPAGGLNGAALANALETAFPNGQIYGSSDTTGNYDKEDRKASIIGVRSGGQWKIFAQKHDATTGDYRIRSVWQIYPVRAKQ